MRVALSLILGGLIAAYTFYNVMTGLKPWAPKIIDMCFHPSSLSTVRTSYTGFRQLDGFICSYVTYTQQPFKDYFGYPFQILLWSAFGTVYAMMAFEGSRRGFQSKTFLAAFPLFGLLANFIGISVVLPLIWIPLLFWTYETEGKTPQDYTIGDSDVWGIFVALLLGYALPSALLVIPQVFDLSSNLGHETLSIWQVLPIILTPLIGFFTNRFKPFFASPSSPSISSDANRKHQIASGKVELQRCYLLLASINTIIYFGVFLYIKFNGFYIRDSILMLLNAPDKLPAGLTFQELGQLLCTRSVLVELLSLTVSFVLWTSLNSGVLAGLQVAVASLFLGPAAALCFYNYFRENSVQDLVEKNPESVVNKILAEKADKVKKQVNGKVHETKKQIAEKVNKQTSKKN